MSPRPILSLSGLDSLRKGVKRYHMTSWASDATKAPFNRRQSVWVDRAVRLGGLWGQGGVTSEMSSPPTTRMPSIWRCRLFHGDNILELRNIWAAQLIAGYSDSDSVHLESSTAHNEYQMVMIGPFRRTAVEKFKQYQEW